MTGSPAAVSSFNEWDPLEEVIVGVLEGAVLLPWETSLAATLPLDTHERVRAHLQEFAGTPFPEGQVAAAQKELAEFVHILEAEGVTVRRPDPIDQSRPYATPDWTSVAGNAQSDPRDVLLVLGDEIIESSMSWRARYFEHYAYRRLVREYFKKGARWTTAPKSLMADDLYDPNFKRGQGWVTTEVEPVFDAADVSRFGKDLIVQRSHTTNELGIEWLRRHAGDRFRVHRVEFHDERAIHIDATLTPLAPGKVMLNPDRPFKSEQMAELFKKSGWDILVPPRTTIPRDAPQFRLNEWLHMNVLSLDEQRVIVEKNEEPFIQALKDWGFKPIPCAFRNNYRFGGSFHCATVDIRRRGIQQSYFNQR